jgi:membrane associated rhomboid family serine protease
MNMRGMGSFSLFPPVMKMLLIINLAVFILQYLFLSGLTFDGVSLNDLFMKYFALQPFKTENMFDLSKNIFLPWQLISYQFMHGGLWHLFFNMFALWMFGSELEGLWGSKRFLIYYLLAGIGAAIVHMFSVIGFGLFALGGICCNLSSHHKHREISHLDRLFRPKNAPIF